MSKADEIFEELGFEKTMPYENIILYENDKMEIEFWLDRQMLTSSGNITIAELQAINEKVKELGWNE